MTILRRLILACAGTALLAGCSDDGATIFDATEFEDEAADFLALDAAAAEQAVTPDATPQPAGSATYQGNILITSEAFDDTDVILGDLSLTANFDADQISGLASDFVNSSGRSYGGALNVANGAGGLPGINPTPGGVFAQGTLSGNLTDVSTDTYAFAPTQMAGTFLGPSYDYIQGDTRGGSLTRTPAGVGGVGGPVTGFTGEYTMDRQ